ncbi:electron transport complex subunit RsxC [Cardiobacteriaceae bacterium TAE3-ERU3]|nr:electron transport complex subunit RsxC [Cardiobacteriaceae bacterium TAE3-ERU3]
MKLLDWIKNLGTANPIGQRGFHGGLHVPAHKSQSTQQPSSAMPIPAQLYVSLRQRDGEMQIPQVKVGDKVQRGQIISIPSSHASVPRHAPTSGTVSAIMEHADVHPSNLPAQCIVIDCDGHDAPAPELPDLSNWQDEQRDVLLERIYQCGIAGMGGAGFPTARKLGHATNTLVVNAAECEPYITCDDLQIRECAAEVIKGAQISAHILEAEHILFGIEDDKPEAIAALKAAAEASGDERIRVEVVPVRYPSGNSRQLFELLLGIRVPPDQHAADYGLICHNSATMKAIHDAVVLGQPLIERYVSVTGEAVAKPQVLRVRIGTPISELITHAGGAQDDARLIIGGPMMGHELSERSAGLKKTTNCVLLLPATPREVEQNCIRCARCSDACPMELLPQQLYWYSRNSEHKRLEQYRLFDCIECGICASVCPSNIPLVQYYRHSKADIRHTRQQQALAERARERHEARQARLEREKAEREARMAAKRARLQAAQAAKPAPADSKDDKQSAIEAAKARAAERRAARAQEANTSPAAQTGQPSSFNPTAHDNSASDPRKQAIEAAKARAAVRKAGKAQNNEQDSATPSEQSREDKLAAAKAKAAERRAAHSNGKENSTPAAQIGKPSGFNPTAHANPDSDPRKQAIEAAKARAAARRAAHKQQKQDEPDSSQDVIQEQPTTDDNSEREQKLAAAKARAAERRAARQQKAEPEQAQDSAQKPIAEQPTTDDNSEREQKLAAAKAKAAERRAARQQRKNDS